MSSPQKLHFVSVPEGETCQSLLQKIRKWEVDIANASYYAVESNERKVFQSVVYALRIGAKAHLTADEMKGEILKVGEYDRPLVIAAIKASSTHNGDQARQVLIEIQQDAASRLNDWPESFRLYDFFRYLEKNKPNVIDEIGPRIENDEKPKDAPVWFGFGF